MTLLSCTEDGCEREAESTLYSRCYGCDNAYCDAHLLYCIDHENQHCNECCVTDYAPPKAPRIGTSDAGFTPGGFVR